MKGMRSQSHSTLITHRWSSA